VALSRISVSLASTTGRLSCGTGGWFTCVVGMVVWFQRGIAVIVGIGEGGEGSPFFWFTDEAEI